MLLTIMEIVIKTIYLLNSPEEYDVWLQVCNELKCSRCESQGACSPAQCGLSSSRPRMRARSRNARSGWRSSPSPGCPSTSRRRGPRWSRSTASNPRGRPPSKMVPFFPTSSNPSPGPSMASRSKRLTTSSMTR